MQLTHLSVFLLECFNYSVKHSNIVLKIAIHKRLNLVGYSRRRRRRSEAGTWWNVKVMNKGDEKMDKIKCKLCAIIYSDRLEVLRVIMEKNKYNEGFRK